MNETKVSESLGMVIHFVKDDDLTKEDIESLWQQGVNMDDWDYMLLCPPDVVHEVKKRDDWDHSEYTEFDCKDWWLDGMLRGCSSNRWYRANLRGKEWAIGIAYHA
jgi:hypothetical protein